MKHRALVLTEPKDQITARAECRVCGLWLDFPYLNARVLPPPKRVLSLCRCGRMGVWYEPRGKGCVLTIEVRDGTKE